MGTQTLDYRERRRERPGSDAAELLIDLSAVRADVVAQATAILDNWGHRALSSSSCATLENLAHYLACRRLDTTILQHRLRSFGFARIDSDPWKVLASMDAIIATLERLVGVPASPYPVGGAILDEDSLRRIARDGFFGGTEAMPALLVELPAAAANDPGLVRDLMTAGMTCAKIDCAKGDPAHWREMIVNLRIAERELGRACRILMEIPGPCLRVSAVAGLEKRRVMRGDTIVLAGDINQASDRGVTIACSSFELLRGMQLGDRVWMSEGRLSAQAVACSEDRIHLEVVCARPKGEKIRAGKRIVFAGGDPDMRQFARADLASLDFIAENADIAWCSSAETIELIQQMRHGLLTLRRARAPMPIVVAIRTEAAFANLPRLIAEIANAGPMAVLLSDGDISVHCGARRLALLREEALRICQAAAIPTIWTSPALDDLSRDGLAAAAGAAGALSVGRFDCVALRDGPRLLEATRLAHDILSSRDARGQDSCSFAVPSPA